MAFLVCVVPSSNSIIGEIRFSSEAQLSIYYNGDLHKQYDHLFSHLPYSKRQPINLQELKEEAVREYQKENCTKSWLGYLCK